MAKEDNFMEKQTAGHDQLGDFAPKFAHYNDDILFGEVWADPALSPKERSIATLSVLIGKGILDSSLKYHLLTAKKNGLTKEEMVSLLTQLGFYAGWPNAWAAFRLAKEVYAEDKEDPQSGLFPLGEENKAYAKYFVGKSYLKMLTPHSALAIANVTFEPGCRNNWHIHHASKNGGQILLVTSGRGYYQEEGKPARALLPGDVVEIPAGVKHWHGAAKDSYFSHLAIEVPGENSSTEWCEKVSEEDYQRLP